VHKNKLPLPGQQQGVGARLVQRVALQHDVGTKTARALNLDARSEARHNNHRAHSQPLRMVSDTLRVVARAHGNDAAGALIKVELRQLVAGAALFERRGELQVFELQEHLRASDIRERARGHAGRSQQVALQALGGGLNVGEFNHGCIVHVEGLRVNLTSTSIQELTVTAKCFETAQGMSDYQAERELQEALRVYQMTPAARFTWLQETWGRLQDSAAFFNADARRASAAARCYATMDEKNRFEDERELRQALQIRLAYQK